MGPLAVTIKGLSETEITQQAERGDLRPQFNPHAVITWPLHERNGFDPDSVLRFLQNRFFELSRPIADACSEPGLDMRLGDAGRFFYLVETLQGMGHEGLDGMLRVFLDEFSQLEQRSYDELYLWCIVELSRRSAENVAMFWPMALTLDLRFRAKPWQRPADAALVDQPYRLTELVMYYYVLYTISQPTQRRRYPSLARCLRRVLPCLSDGEKRLLKETLEDLARQEKKPAFGDANGLLRAGKLGNAIS
jgi:hypothetical protein